MKVDIGWEAVILSLRDLNYGLYCKEAGGIDILEDGCKTTS